MKRITQLVLGLMGIMLVFAACNKTDDTPPPYPPLGLKASLKGYNIVDTLTTAKIIYNLGDNTQKLTLTGGNNFTISTNPPLTMYLGVKIELDSFWGIGDYNISETGRAKAWFLLNSFEIPAKTGLVHVKSYSIKQTTGFFQFATDTLSVTDGSFNLHIQ